MAKAQSSITVEPFEVSFHVPPGQAYEAEAKACPDLRLLKWMSNHLEVLQIPVELACALRHPGLCMHAFCEPAALLLSMIMTPTHSRCNATSGDTLRSKGRT